MNAAGFNHNPEVVTASLKTGAKLDDRDTKSLMNRTPRRRGEERTA